jgi:hypothetical protein
MFGKNDNSLTNNNNPFPTDTPPAAPGNPFGDTDSPVPPLGSPAPQPPVPVSPPAPPAMPPLPAASPPPSSPPNNDSLLDLKQQALQNLQPLVSHLEQSPEEKFKTTMMLIQATDNSALVKDAYAAANQITDEKAKAQALLDVVNEINYFTHQASDGEAETKA